jgi:hypothetical protein
MFDTGIDQCKKSRTKRKGKQDDNDNRLIY